MDDKLMNCSTGELQWCPDTDYNTNPRPNINCDDDDDEHFGSTISFSNASPAKNNAVPPNSKLMMTPSGAEKPQQNLPQPSSHNNNNHCAKSVQTASATISASGTLPHPPPPHPQLANSNGYINNHNFDINLAEVDIETFRSEDLIQRMIRSQNQLDASTDTLRIVESLRSLNDMNSPTKSPLKVPTDLSPLGAKGQSGLNDQSTISVDSLDLSLDGSINARLIEQCSQQNNKHRYRIALFDTSTHSALDGSVDFGPPAPPSQNGRNPFEDPPAGSQGPQGPTTPGSLVKMFMQNRGNSQENSYYSSSSTEAFGPRDGAGDHLLRSGSQQVSCATPSVATVDSGDLPLHVLDISKKLRSMNLRNGAGNPAVPSSSSISSNTSFTSTTSSSTFDNNHRTRGSNSHRPRAAGTAAGNQYSTSSTNPFVMEESRASTRSTSTQFPEMFQEKGIQASPDESPGDTSSPTSSGGAEKSTPVLVYYPNYSLPDLSFLDDILREKAPVYLSPVKHEPPRPFPAPPGAEYSTHQSQTTGPVRTRTQQNGVQKRINRKSLVGMPGPSSSSSGAGSAVNPNRKCRPKSYTDYEMLLTQEFNPIQDWDSLNLLLPDDFKDFMEKNNLLPVEDQKRTSGPLNYPIKHHHYPPAGHPGNPHLPHPQVRLRQNVNRTGNRASQRYSLQEMMQWNPVIFNEEHEHELAGSATPTQVAGNAHYESIAGSSMIRSQTMPSCVPPPVPHPVPGMQVPYPYPYHLPAHVPYPHYPPPGYPVASPHQLPNMTSWDMISSSSFQKLMNFLSKLDNDAAPEVPPTQTPPQPPTQHSNHRSTAHTQPEVTSHRAGARLPPQPKRPAATSTSTAAAPSTGTSRASISQRTKAVNSEPNSVSGPPPRIPPRNPNLQRSSVIRPEVNKRTAGVSTGNSTVNSTSGSSRTTGSTTKIVLKRPSTLKSGIPLPTARPSGGQSTFLGSGNGAQRTVTRTALQNYNTQAALPATGTTARQLNSRRTYRPPF